MQDELMKLFASIVEEPQSEPEPFSKVVVTDLAVKMVVDVERTLFLIPEKQQAEAVMQVMRQLLITGATRLAEQNKTDHPTAMLTMIRSLQKQSVK